MWYHLIVNVEDMFENLEQAEQYVQKLNQGKPIDVRVPKHPMPRENRTVPRISLAPTVELCVQALGTHGVFHRCVSAHPDTFCFMTRGNECYPVIEVQFRPNPHVYYPSPAMVPDACFTLEHWLLSPTRPDRAEIRWFDQTSVTASPDNRYVVLSCSTMDTDEARERHYNHPWLNGKGHTLLSRDMET